jgi:HlyD family secretion protein
MSELGMNHNETPLLVPRRRRGRKFIVMALTAVLLVGGGVYGYKQYKEPAASTVSQVHFMQVKRGDVTETVSASGTVQVSEEVRLSFSGTGRLTQVNVKVGDSVKAGDVLAVLDDSTVRAQIANSEANVRAAEAKLLQAKQGATKEQLAVQEANLQKAKVALDGAKKAYENQKLLYEDRSAAAQAVTNAENALKKAETDKRNAEASLTAAKAKLKQAQTTTASPEAIHAAQVALEMAKNQLANAQEQLDIAYTTSARISANTQVYNAQTSVANAEKNLADLMKGPDANAIVQAESAVQQAQIAYDQSVYNYNSAVDALTSARQSYNDRTQAKAQLDNAKNNLDQAQASYDVAVAQYNQTAAPPDETAILSAQVALDQAKAQLQSNLVSLENLSLRAPMDAIVTQVNGKAGEQTSGNNPVVVLQSAHPDDLQVLAQVSQSDVGRLKTGQLAEIVTSAYPDKVFAGKVLMIYPQATTQNGVTSYNVLLSVENKDGLLKAGMTSNVTVKTGEKKDVLYVPTMALKELNGKEGVYVRREEAAMETDPSGAQNDLTFRPVKFGLFSSERVEIVSGLSEGEEVAVTLGSGGGGGNQRNGLGIGNLGGRGFGTGRGGR